MITAQQARTLSEQNDPWELVAKAIEEAAQSGMRQVRSPISLHTPESQKRLIDLGYRLEAARGIVTICW